MNNRLNKYKYPGAKRLMLEAQELKDNTEDYCAQPIDDNLFEWHFTVRGPPDTAFDGGYYHGRLSFPTEYPMKPPSIILLTPNGRFKTNKKICLSISGYHPETWQPSWSVRTALLALIAFMPSPANGAIGSLNFSDVERRKLALSSRTWECETCGRIKDLLIPPVVKVEESSRAGEYDADSSRLDATSIDRPAGNQCQPNDRCQAPNDRCDIEGESNNSVANGSSKASSSSSSFSSSSGSSVGGGSDGEDRDALFESENSRLESDKLRDGESQSNKYGATNLVGNQLNTNSNSPNCHTVTNFHREEVIDINERRRTYPPLIWKSIFALLLLLIIRRVFMIIQS